MWDGIGLRQWDSFQFGGFSGCHKAHISGRSGEEGTEGKEKGKIVPRSAYAATTRA